MRERALLVVLGATIGVPLTGCDFGLIDPPVELSGVAVRIHVVADAVAETRAVTVQVDPGSGADGGRVAADPRLWINGGSILPTADAGNLTYTFLGTLSIPPGTLNIRPPTFADNVASPDSVLVSVLAVAAPDTISVAAGGSITLNLHGTVDPNNATVAAPGLAAHSRSARWRAMLVPDSASAASGASTISIDTQGSLLSSSIEIPVGLLGPEFSAGALFLEVRAVTELQSEDGLYRLSVERTAVEAAEILIQQ